MLTWIHIFSKFTPELLLWLLTCIGLLSSGYLLFWILKKRPHGIAKNTIPAGLVKFYLNQLMIQTEQLHEQLFGVQSQSKNHTFFFLQKQLMDQLAERNEELNQLKQTLLSRPTSQGLENNEHLTKKINELEEKLSEYRVLEEEFANLKNLQQENLLLKTTLTEHQLPVPQPAPPPEIKPDPDPAPPQPESDLVTEFEKMFQGLPTSTETAPIKKEEAH